MRQHVLVVIALWIAILASPASAGTHAKPQLSCKRVRDAVWANHTLEQLTAEFDTDAQHIMKCLQAKKGKKPAAPKKAKKGTPRSGKVQKKK